MPDAFCILLQRSRRSGLITCAGLPLDFSDPNLPYLFLFLFFDTLHIFWEWMNESIFHITYLSGTFFTWTYVRGKGLIWGEETPGLLVWIRRIIPENKGSPQIASVRWAVSEQQQIVKWRLQEDVRQLKTMSSFLFSVREKCLIICEDITILEKLLWSRGSSYVMGNGGPQRTWAENNAMS